jgi:hypothetical protein
MSKKSVGAKVWLVPDSYLPDRHNGDLESHESACILNVSRRPAKLKFSFYFEDRAPIKACEAVCPAERTVHVRLNNLKSRKGETIPIAKPMAYVVESNVNVVVQHTRLDTSQAALALMTTIGYPAK